MQSSIANRQSLLKVIFHGDDFGLTAGVNRGIIRAFREGLLTSTSIIAAGEAADEAISLARDNPGLDVGVHLTLCDERPLLRPRELSSIIPRGDRLPSRAHLLQAILSGRIDYQQAAAEWRAQVETILDAGIPVSHVDSHQFVHLFPGLISVCREIVKAYHIPFVRAAVHDPPSLTGGIGRLVQWTGLATWSRGYALRRLASACRVIPTVGFVLAGGRMTRKALLQVFSRLQSKTVRPMVEVMLHPGSGDVHTMQKYRHWDYDWKQDLDLLTDPHLKNDLSRYGIQPTAFGNEA
jgi:chitin disaccharide deacetylase